ncbi:1-(5-phosphoribosyl)-5-[(5-phosphoribosylamino)methylideneamino]imidazole-4-carboxamide isomerase [Lactococcus allomyrinae]|uniref:1-(5-phosphoribosyl)-5-[(5-phosphoribosylamino)methylideneamino] imidazole-4-carboxamide isomerase n=1 Tax=Lactococcus allomyrinae TaxID=2419773 RepID=A0A387B8P2_9LACT|nr:1-(5-phosphoribosyl)-5-[(5-phosphoribosylamino)methylideneamino]imidazole-4-carboxamide isomerase [Lactococcus allomyrinae]AYG00185.1 1-(5-phosphoribosyl)-5-[(5-phosphoribosylamino)methylideneamino]imidazole-4-carboxamide isomerase [Lactococcus allomyrinae]
MLIIPAIDLKDGKVVRLYHGDYSNQTTYSEFPEQIAQNFEKMGAKHLHVVDLDGAKEGKTTNIEIIKKIKATTQLQIQVGGGVRTPEVLALYLEKLGINRVILGTAALEHPDFLKTALKKYGAEKIVVGVDIKKGYVSTSGWLKTSDVPYLIFLKKLEKMGVGYVVITDISRDGTLTGPNFSLYEEIAQKTSLKFVVSGGVKDREDIIQARQKDYYAIIVGKAYYEGKINLEEVLRNVE